MVATNSLNINGNGVVSFDNTTGVFSESTLTQHDVLIGGATNNIVSVSPSTATFVLTSNGTGSDPSFQAVSSSGAIITIDGDTGSMTPTAGVVTISGGTTGLTTTASASTMDLTGTLNVGHGGTGLATLSTYQLLAGGTTGTGNVQQVGIGTSGQVLTSNGAGALPTFQTPGSVNWVDVVTSSQTIVPEVGYVTDNATIVTYTLPATAAFGTIFEITGGINASATLPWTIAQNAGQSIKFGNSSTTVGVTGTLSATLQYDSVRVLTVVANTTFVVLDSLGNLLVA